MLKTRAAPILASAAIALSLGACQWMGGDAARQQTSSAQPASGAAAESQGSVQAVAPDLVKNVQRTLSQRGYDAGPADGIYGDSTQQAVRNFQRDQKLHGSGQLDSQTLAALGVVAEGSRAATAPAQQQEYQSTSKRGAMMQDQRRPASRQQASNASGLSRDQVRGLQQELSSRGYDAGQADGRWGNRTQQALSQFQKDQNLPASGRPDQRTMAALGIERGTTQTGQMPADRNRQRSGEQTGQLPETQAPRAAPPQDRPEADAPAPLPEDAAPRTEPSPGAPGEPR